MSDDDVPDRPFALISYRHESPQHSGTVLELAERLRQAGLQIILDQDHALEGPATGWPLWMQVVVERASALVVVWSEGYRRSWNRDSTLPARGARWESRHILARFYGSEDPRRLISVLLDAGDLKHVPAFLQAESPVHQYPLDLAEICQRVSRWLEFDLGTGTDGEFADRPPDGRTSVESRDVQDPATGDRHKLCFSDPNVDSAASYLRWLEGSCSRLLFPGSTRRFELRDLYQEIWVAATPDTTGRFRPAEGGASPSDPVAWQKLASEGPEESQLELREEIEHALGRHLAVAWSDIARSSLSPVLVLGQAGTGKTTLLRWQAAQMSKAALDRLTATGRESEEPIALPVLVQANRVYESLGGRARTGFGSLDSLLKAALSPLQPFFTSRFHSPSCERFLEELGTSFPIHLLVDGLDEAPKHLRNGLLRGLLECSKRLAGNLVVCTRSSETSSLYLNEFKFLFVQPLDQRDAIPQLVRAWFRHRAAERSDLLLRQLRSHRRALALAENPLSLTLLCSIASDGEGVLPSRLVDLYASVTHYLLNVWPSSEGRAAVAEFGLGLALQRLAWRHRVSGQSLTPDSMVQILTEVGPDCEFSYVDARGLLEHLIRVAGILCRRQSEGPCPDTYQFFHTSVGDYYAARAAVQEPAKWRRILADLADERWRDSIPLIAGLVDRPAELLRAVMACQKFTVGARQQLLAEAIAECKEGSILHEEIDAIALSCCTAAQLAADLPWRRLQAHALSQSAIRFLASAEKAAGELAGIVTEIRQKGLYPDEKARHPPETEYIRDGAGRLLACLQSRFSVVRWTAIWFLAVIRDSRALAPLIALLQDADSKIRLMATWALGLLKQREAAPALMSRLEDSAWEVRKHACSSLGMLTHRAASRRLVDLAENDPRIEVKRSAFFALSKIIGSYQSPDESGLRGYILESFFRYNDAKIISSLSVALGIFARKDDDFRPEGVAERLLSLLEQEGQKLRAAAAFSLAQLAQRGDGSVLLESYRREASPSIKGQLALALAKVRYRDANSVLCRGLMAQDRVSWHRHVRALKMLHAHSEVEGWLVSEIAGTDDASGLSLLRKISSSFFVHKIFLPRFLAGFGRESPASRDESPFVDQVDDEVVLGYLELLEHENPWCRLQSVNFFIRQESPVARRGCLARLQDPSASVRAAACIYFQAIIAPQAVDPCLALLADPYEKVRACACHTLSRYGDDRSIPRVRELLWDASAMVRSAACVFFRTFCDARAENRLVELLEDHEAKVRATACGTLQVRGPLEAPLSRSTSAAPIPTSARFKKRRMRGGDAAVLRLLTDSDPEVRSTACAYFATFPHEIVTSRCVELIEDPDPRVRMMACLALERIAPQEAARPCFELLWDSDSDVLAVTCGAVRQLSAALPQPLAEIAERRLHELASHSVSKVARSATYALNHIQDRQ